MAIKIENIIAQLLKDPSPPLKHRLKENGTLVVIAENGMKFKFSAEQVEQARIELTLKSKTEPKPKTRTEPKQAQSKTATRKAPAHAKDAS